MDREHRRELKHDRFVDEVGALSQKAQENQRLLIGIAVAVLLVAFGGYGWFFYSNQQEKKAQVVLAGAIETIDSPLIPAEGTPPAGAKYKTEAERVAAAEKQFREVASKFAGTDAADVAGLYLARIEATRGNVPAARKLLQAFIDNHSDHLLVGSARYSLYQMRIGAGEAQQVTAEINSELSKPEPILPSDSLLILLAQAYDAQGNTAKSKETYKRITTEFPDSPFVLEAQRRVGSA
jgi:predicted negative regulator of RcsB-dependent stress response